MKRPRSPQQSIRVLNKYLALRYISREMIRFYNFMAWSAWSFVILLLMSLIFYENLGVEPIWLLILLIPILVMAIYATFVSGRRAVLVIIPLTTYYWRKKLEKEEQHESK